MRYLEQYQHEASARQLAEILYAEDIPTEVEMNSHQQWEVWVVREDHVQRAVEILKAYRANPEASEHIDAVQLAQSKRQKQLQYAMADEKRAKKRDKFWKSVQRRSAGYATYALIAGSIALTLLTRQGQDMRLLRWLLISQYEAAPGFIWWHGLVELQHGQLWRLISPIFIHFGIWHILFNMLWLRDLGCMIEAEQGSRALLVKIAVIAILSNLAQYAFSGPFFGGMSGVVYGMLGYIWMKGKYDPNSDLFLHPTTVTMMIAWFFFGVFGIMPNIANFAHGAGLLIGMVWGFISAKSATQR